MMNVGERTWIEKRSKEAVDWKSALAQYGATHLVGHGDALYVGSGTTLSQIVFEIISRQASGELLDLLVITSNLQVIGMGREKPGVEKNSNDREQEAQARFLKAFQATQIAVTGGVLNPSLDALTGDEAVRAILDPDVHPGTVFFGARGLSFRGRLSITYQFRDEISAQVAYATRPTNRRVILCDHTKLGITKGIRAAIDIDALLDKCDECIFLSTLPEPHSKEAARVQLEVEAFEELCAKLLPEQRYRQKELALWMITRTGERKKVISLMALREKSRQRKGSTTPNHTKVRQGSTGDKAGTISVASQPKADAA